MVANALHLAGEGSGNGDYIVITNQANFNMSTTITISAWVKGWPRDDWDCWVSKWGENGQGWQLRRYSNQNQVCFTTRGTAPEEFRDSHDLDMTHWHYLAGVLNTGWRGIYVDGVLNASDTPVGSIGDTTVSPVIGARFNGGGGLESAHFNGEIDEVRVESVPRSSNWVWACYMNMVSNGVFNSCNCASRLD